MISYGLGRNCVSYDITGTVLAYMWLYWGIGSSQTSSDRNTNNLLWLVVCVSMYNRQLGGGVCPISLAHSS